MKIEVVTAAMLCVGTGLLSGMLTARCIRRTKKEPELERLEVPVPEGKLIAYSSGDPDYPGIHVKLKKNGIPYALNLATVEYDVDDDCHITHVWGDASMEDTTHDIYHTHVSDYFDETGEGV